MELRKALLKTEKYTEIVGIRRGMFRNHRIKQNTYRCKIDTNIVLRIQLVENIFFFLSILSFFLQTNNFCVRTVVVVHDLRAYETISTMLNSKLC